MGIIFSYAYVKTKINKKKKLIVNNKKKNLKTKLNIKRKNIFIPYWYSLRIPS